MLSATTLVRPFMLLPLLALSSCALRTSTESDANAPVDGAITASWCLGNEEADPAAGDAEPVDVSDVQSLCIDLVGGKADLVASGLAAGSQLIVTGAGNELVFDVENSLFNTQLGGEIVAGDFAVKGVWASGEELELVVDQ